MNEVSLASGSFSAASVIALSADQSKCLAQAEGFVELRDNRGETIGYLLCNSQITRFYSPAEIAELERRAADRTPGRTLDEILKEVRVRVGA